MFFLAKTHVLGLTKLSKIYDLKVTTFLVLSQYGMVDNMHKLV